MAERQHHHLDADLELRAIDLLMVLVRHDRAVREVDFVRRAVDRLHGNLVFLQGGHGPDNLELLMGRRGTDGHHQRNRDQPGPHRTTIIRPS